MKDLAALLVALTQAASQPAGRAAGRVAGVVVAMTLAGFSLMVAAGCAVAALWLYAIPIVGTVGAPLITAAALLVLAAIALGWARFLCRPRPAPPPAGETMAMVISAVVAGIVAGSRRS